MQYFPNFEDQCDGVGIEIRYNFNPNDSSSIRKDVDMANKLKEENLHPVYLINSAISPRDEAIERLKRAGWNFVIGENASNFTTSLYSTDFLEIMSNENIKQKIHEDVKAVMSEIFDSDSFLTARPPNS